MKDKFNASYSQVQSTVRPHSVRLPARRCPVCDEITMPNIMLNGKVYCSCPNHKLLEVNE